METNASMEQVLDNLDKNRVYKTKNSMLTGLILVSVGITSLIMYSRLELTSESLMAQFIFVAGAILFTIGIFKIFNRKNYYISANNHQKLKVFELYFNVSERDKLVRLLETGNLSGIKDLNSAVVDGLKLRVMATKDGLLCFSQAIGFVSYEYVNITPVMDHSKAEYEILSGIKQSGK